MPVIRPSFVFAAALALSVPAMAIKVSTVAQLPAPDRLAVDTLEQFFFDGVEKNGIDAHISAQFKSMGREDRISDELHASMQRADKACGKLRTVERYRSESFGSRVVRDFFVTSFDGCTIRWVLTYAKKGDTWAFDRFDLKSLDGDEWPY